MTRVTRTAAALALVTSAFAACDESPDLAPQNELTIAVNVPASESPFVGQTIARGVFLAVNEINERGGVQIGDTA